MSACLVKHEECHAKDMANEAELVAFCSLPANKGKAVPLMSYEQKQQFELKGTQIEIDCLEKAKRGQRLDCARIIDGRIKMIQAQRTKCEEDPKDCNFK